MRLVFIFLCVGVFGQERWIPHIPKNGGGFKAVLVFTNNNQADTNLSNVTVSAYNESGSFLKTNNAGLYGGYSIEMDIDVYFGRNDVSHLKITGPENIHVQIVYRKDSGSLPANTFSSTPSKGWRIWPGDKLYGWDGVAIVNPTGTSKTVKVVLYDGTGKSKGQFTVSLSGYQKKLEVLSNWFNPQPHDYIAITSESPILVTALRGTHDGKVMAGSPALAFEPETETQTGDTNRDKTLLLKGNWAFTYTIISTYTDKINLTDLVTSTTLESGWAMYGYDPYGNKDVIGAYFPSTKNWAVLDDGSTIDNYYRFTTDGSKVLPGGCYYLISPSGSTNLGTCRTLTGTKTANKNVLFSDNEDLWEELKSSEQGKMGDFSEEVPEEYFVLRALLDELKKSP